MRPTVEWPFEIVVAAYGDSPLLAETLRSLARFLPEPGPQVTVLDDASPTDVVRALADQAGSRVRYVRNPRNLGVSGAFNAAMSLSQSRYTILVGPDDRILPAAAKTYCRAIQRFDGAAAIHPLVAVIDEGGHRARPLTDRIKQVIRPSEGVQSGESLATRLLLGNWTYNPAIAWRTDFVRDHPFDESLHTAMDLDLLLRLAFAGEAVGLSDERTFEYRRHGGAVSSGNRGQKRLSEELRIQRSAHVAARRLGWRRAAVAAELALSSRLHGLLLAAAGSQWTWRERRAVARLALSPTSRA